MKDITLRYKNTDYAATIAVAVVMIMIPMAHYSCVKGRLTSDHMADTIYLCAAACAVFNCIAAYINKNRIAVTIYEKLILAMVVFEAVSVVCARDVHTALWGQPAREEGFFMLLSYYTFFYTARFVVSGRGRRIVTDAFLAIQAIHSIYGLRQYFDIHIELSAIFDSYHYAISGVAGNPDFMAALMVLTTGVAVGMMYKSNTKTEKTVYGVLSALYIWTLVLTKTALGIIGVAVIAVILFVSLMKNSRYRVRVVMILLTSLAVTAYIMEFVFYKGVSLRVASVISQFKSVLQNGFSDPNVASGRLVIWANSFELVRGNLLTGVGADGLLEPYFQHYGLLDGRFVDKCHNEFLQILVTMGLPVLVCYVSIAACAADDMIKKAKASKVHYALMLGFAGYMVQSSFNISVIDVTPYLWIVMGLAVQGIIRDEQPLNQPVQ